MFHTQNYVQKKSKAYANEKIVHAKLKPLKVENSGMKFQTWVGFVQE